VNAAALGMAVLINIVEAWYPFTLDLPKRIGNTATRLQDGAWELNGRSRVTARAPDAAAATMDNGPFRLTVEAQPAMASQSGPARLFSIGSSPYDPSLMIGVDHNQVALFIPCDGAASSIDAEWRVPLRAQQDIAVTMWFPGGASGAGPRIQVNDQEPMELENHCPAGTSPQAPDAEVPWALGNVHSGHRPFVGRINKLEIAEGERRIDLLRETRWQAPASFWVWPERLYIPSNDAEHERIAASLHVASFIPLGYFMGRVARPLAAPRMLAIVFAFAAILNGGKILISGRHPSIIDVLLNLVGAGLGLLACRQFAAGDGLTSRSH
jgi:VanZ like family